MFCSRRYFFSSAAIITGICQLQEPTKLAIWGRRELCILTLSANYTCIASIERHADLAGSWILNCVSVKPNKLVVGLAENGQFAVVEPDSVEKISYPIEGNISCFDCNENMLAVGDVFGTSPLLPLPVSCAGRIRVSCAHLECILMKLLLDVVLMEAFVCGMMGF